MDLIDQPSSSRAVAGGSNMPWKLMKLRSRQMSIFGSKARRIDNFGAVRKELSGLDVDGGGKKLKSVGGQKRRASA